MRNTHSDGPASFFDFITTRLETDRFLSIALAAVAVLVGLTSTVAGIAAWPVVFNFRHAGSLLALVSHRIVTAGWITMLVCGMLLLWLLMFQHRRLSFGASFGFSLCLCWVVFTIVLITFDSVMDALLMGSFMGRLLWIVISFFCAYVLSVVPAILLALITGAANAVLDAILPE